MSQDSEEIVIPPLSPRLRAVIVKLLDETADTTPRFVELIERSIPEYTQSSDTSLSRELTESVELHSRLWYLALLNAEAISPDSMKTAISFASHRVYQAISLVGFLRAFRVGARGLWNLLLRAAGKDRTLHQELLFKVSPYLMYHFDVIAQVVAQAYNTEQMQQARWRDRLRHELWSVLLTRLDDVEGFRRQAHALGLNTLTPHCAMALRLVDISTLSPRLEESLDRVIDRIAEIMSIDRESFMRTVFHDHLLFWLPVPHGDTLIDNDRNLATQAFKIVASVDEVEAAGVGLPGTGPRGWRLSADQALKAIELSVVGDKTINEVYRYSEIALDDAVTASENVMRFFEALIERLASEPKLLETLQTYFDLRQHHKAVAAALEIHPNTLSHRLKRVESVLGARLDNSAWVAKLHTALRLRRRSLQAAARSAG